jgi:hypothetical protein
LAETAGESESEGEGGDPMTNSIKR